MFGEYQRKPHKFLDYLLKTYHLKNDAALARRLNCKSPLISKVRNGKAPIGAAIILEIHEEFEMPIKDIKTMIAESRE
jgi:hypothetical protein